MASIRKVKKRLKREIALLKLCLANWNMIGDSYFDSMVIEGWKLEIVRLEAQLASLEYNKYRCGKEVKDD